jgi:hypothetical protein
MGYVTLIPTLPDTVEFIAAMKTTGGREFVPLPERHQTVQLFCRDGNRKLLPTFGTAPFKHYLAVFGLHALAETMRAFSPNSARLVCAFAHDIYSL